MPPSYPGNRTGWWGVPTATIDWCEENYVVTQYVAEFWNTITNVIFIIPAALALYRAVQCSLEDRYIVGHAGVLIIGVGSWAFHCTLLHASQLLDELPMLFGICSFLYCMWTCNYKPGRSTWLPMFVTFSCSFLISVIYVAVNEPLFHEVCYGLIVTVLLIHSYYRGRTLGGSMTLYTVSLATLLVGFMLWNVEVQLCPHIRQIRGSIVWPLKPVTQLHAMWHLLTGVASHVHLLYSCQMRMQSLGYPCKLVTYGGCIPILQPPKDWIKQKYSSAKNR